MSWTHAGMLRQTNEQTETRSCLRASLTQPDNVPCSTNTSSTTFDKQRVRHLPLRLVFEFVLERHGEVCPKEGIAIRIDGRSFRIKANTVAKFNLAWQVFQNTTQLDR